MKRLFIRISLSSVAGVTVAVALFLFAACTAFAQEPLKFFDLTIPNRVAGLPHGKTRDSYVGSGYRVLFQRPGWVIVVFSYNYKNSASDIPGDSNSPVIKRELELDEKGTVFELEMMEYIKNVVAKGHYTIGRDGHARFLCSAFTYVSLKDGPRDDYLCLTGWKNKFFKIRMTTQHSKTSREEVRKFVEAWIPVLWPSR